KPPKEPRVYVDAEPRTGGTLNPPDTAKYILHPLGGEPISTTEPALILTGSFMEKGLPSTFTGQGAPVTATTTSIRAFSLAPQSVISRAGALGLFPHRRFARAYEL